MPKELLEMDVKSAMLVISEMEINEKEATMSAIADAIESVYEQEISEEVATTTRNIAAVAAAQLCEKIEREAVVVDCEGMALSIYGVLCKALIVASAVTRKNSKEG